MVDRPFPDGKPGSHFASNRTDMLAYRTVLARHKVPFGSLVRSSLPWAPRAAWICRLGSPWSIGFALPLLMLVGILPAVGALAAIPATQTGQMTFAPNFASPLDENGNSVRATKVIADLSKRWRLHVLDVGPKEGLPATPNGREHGGR